MILYVDSENRIKSVNAVLPDLTPIEVDDAENPFDGWSEAKICCYKVYTATVPVYPEPVEVEDEEEYVEPEPIGTKTVITGYTPYVDSRMIDHIDQLGKATEAITPYTETKTAYIGDTDITFFNTPADGNLTVFFPYQYTVERLSDRVMLHFEELDEVTQVTISIL